MTGFGILFLKNVRGAILGLFDFSDLYRSLVVEPLWKATRLIELPIANQHSGHAKLSEGVRSLEEMPGPKGLPFVGDLFNYLKNSEFKPMMNELKNSFEKYGPIFKRTIMGRTMIWIQDPRDVEIVFKADGRHPMRPGDFLKSDEMYRKSRNLPFNLASL